MPFSSSENQAPSHNNLRNLVEEYCALSNYYQYLRQYKLSFIGYCSARTDEAAENDNKGKNVENIDVNYIEHYYDWHLECPCYGKAS